MVDNEKKIQIVLSDEAWSALDSLTKEANEGFLNGTINCSDVANELISTGKIDICGLQAKHTNIRKSLRLMSETIRLLYQDKLLPESEKQKRFGENFFLFSDSLAYSTL